jgi:hypothetical protein
LAHATDSQRIYYVDGSLYFHDDVPFQFCYVLQNVISFDDKKK